MTIQIGHADVDMHMRVLMLLAQGMHCDGSPVESGQEGKGLAMLIGDGAASWGAAASSSAVTSPSKLKGQTARGDRAQPKRSFL